MRRGVVASEIMVRITKPGALLSLTLTAVGIFMMRRGAVVFFLGGSPLCSLLQIPKTTKILVKIGQLILSPLLKKNQKI